VKKSDVEDCRIAGGLREIVKEIQTFYQNLSDILLRPNEGRRTWCSKINKKKRKFSTRKKVKALPRSRRLITSHCVLNTGCAKSRYTLYYIIYTYFWPTLIIYGYLTEYICLRGAV
jgi:hypothetical protein